MKQTLFIHPDLEFLNRIKTEGGEQVISCASMLQAVQWLTNPEIALLGIYVNPNDPHYSALRFLEVCLIQRPSIPVFLIDSQNEMGPDRPLSFLKNMNVRGVFRGNESFVDFLKPLNTGPGVDLTGILSKITSRNLHAGYIEIPITDYSHLKTHPFDVFVEDQNRGLRLFASKGSAVDPAYLQELKKQTSWLFIEEKAVSSVRSRIREVQSEYQNLEGFPVAWKTAEILFNARMLLKSIQAGGISDTAVEQAGVIIGNLLQLVSHLGQTPNLRRLVQQAKDSDKNVACTTLAVLICKILKFETVSVTEILGVASFFQDIGLYHTPYGDLSAVPVVKMSEEAAKWYVNHPNESADLLAKNANLPEVVLQVIRQHHERKDRSGFPNKVGGLQLHPMAEILSLINAYLDYDHEFDDVKEEVFSHYSDRVVAAFRGLLDLLDPVRQSLK
jgi:hypothetical protein